MSAARKGAGRPRTGLWYAIFLKGRWRIEPWFVSNRRDAGHPDFWAALAEFGYGKALNLPRARILELKEAPYGAPRGRVVSPEEHSLGSRWAVLYGGDGELPQKAKPLLLKAFGLERLARRRRVNWILDDHERRLPEDREVVERIMRGGAPDEA